MTGFEGTSDELNALCVTVGVSQQLEGNEQLLEEIQAKAEEIMQKAQEEFDAFLASKNLESVMGMIIPMQKENDSFKEMKEPKEDSFIAVSGYIMTNLNCGEYDKEGLAYELSRAAVDEILDDIDYRIVDIDSNVLSENNDLYDFIQNSDYDQNAFEDFIAGKIKEALNERTLKIESAVFEPYFERPYFERGREGTDYVVHINIYAKDLIAEFEEAMKEKTEVEEPDR